MSEIKIYQYKHYPNATELGQGNTHETYLRVSKNIDLTEMFPPGEEVVVHDISGGKNYVLKSAYGGEFRINQMGEIYRDHTVRFGDEITLTLVESDNGKAVYLSVKTFKGVVLKADSKGVELFNTENLENFASTRTFVSSVQEQGLNKELEISFSERKKKRIDSPTETDFYKVRLDGQLLDHGLHFLAFDKTWSISKIPENSLNAIDFNGNLLDGVSEHPIKQKDTIQKIFFGTPGSGKSHRVKELTEGKKVHRTTFHPDSDYAGFVGCYKPTMQSSIEDNLSLEELIQRIPEIQNEDNAIGKFTIKYYRSIQKLQATPDREDLRRKIQEAKGAGSDGKSQYAYMNQAIALGAYLEKEKLWRDSSTISYSFTPQVFTEAYIDAWKNPEEEVFLVIEEINRGNCAQIFGDLFQLLDRNNEGYSDYRITADSDLRDYLYSQLGEEHEGIKGGKLSLPPNLRILATMNTSDQSLFPMDSAFKRRWDWEYVPVDYSESVPSSGFVITLGDEEYRWVEFLKMANERIRKATDSEDKQMGNFFIKGNVSEAEFKSKVMFYLWNEVCKDEYGTQNNFFRYRKNNEEVEFSFNDLYQTDGLEILHGFMAYLEVTPSSTKEDTEEESEEPGQD